MENLLTALFSYRSIIHIFPHILVKDILSIFHMRIGCVLCGIQDLVKSSRICFIPFEAHGNLYLTGNSRTPNFYYYYFFFERETERGGGEGGYNDSTAYCFMIIHNIRKHMKYISKDAFI